VENIREAYAARFEAMVADLRREHGEDLYTEASQHAEDGSVLYDPDDELPRRVDCATADGEEYNLEVGEPTPPATDEDFADYPFKVKLHSANWDALAVSVKFTEALSDGQWEDFEQLVRSWYLTGFWGGYSGFLHSLQQLSFGGRSLKCVVDLGSAEVMALHAFLHAVAGFAGESAEVERVSFGEAPSLAS
jgi:hypothetical protein